MTRLKTTVIIVFIFFNITLNAQVLNPVKWNFSSKINDNHTAELIFTANMDKTWHLYSHYMAEGGPIPTSFSFDSSSEYSLIGNIKEIGNAEEKFDETFNMKVRFYSKQVVFKQKIKIIKTGKINITGAVNFMSCNDERCLPPKDVDFKFELDNTNQVSGTKMPAPVKIDKDTSGVSSVKPSKDTISKPQAIVIPVQKENNKSSKSLWWFFLVSLLAGFAGVITPCVFPMIPMTINFFLTRSGNRSRAILQGIIFGISIMLIYTFVGIIVSLTSAGSGFANNLSTHWIPNLIFFLLFIVFGASFFGMFEITLPSGLINKADKQADKGGYLGAFFMALTTVIVSFSCTGPIVGALLVESANGAVIKPTVGMFGFGLAFALPFTFLAIFPGMMKNLPKSGGWLNSIKVVLGFIVLAFSLKFLSVIDQTYHLKLLSREIFLAIWIVLFVLLGLYLLGKIKFKNDSELSHIGFPRFMLALISFVFSIYLVPGLFGAPLNSVSYFLPPQSSDSFNLNNQNNNSKNADSSIVLCNIPKYSDFLELPYGLKGYFDYTEGMACALEKNKPVLLDFNGHACTNCKRMEAKVWSDPEVLKKLKTDFIIISLYVDDRAKLPEKDWVKSEVDGKIKKTIGAKNSDFQILKFQTNSQPYYVITDTAGNLLSEPMTFNTDVKKFINFLNHGIDAFYKK